MLTTFTSTKYIEKMLKRAVKIAKFRGIPRKTGRFRRKSVLFAVRVATVKSRNRLGRTYMYLMV